MNSSKQPGNSPMVRLLRSKRAQRHKTWTAYALYGLLQILSRKLSTAQIYTRVNGGNGAKSDERLKELLKPLLESLASESVPKRIELSISARSFLELDQPQKIGLHGSLLGLAIGTSQERVSDSGVGLEFRRAEIATSILSMDLVFEHPLKRLQVATHRSRHGQDGKTEDSSTLVSLVDEAWTERKILDVLHAQGLNLFENVVVFPAERNGILPVWPLILDSDRLDVPLPVKDFGRFLAVAQTATPAGALSVAQNHLSKLLKQVIGGEIVYVADTAGKRLIFRTAGAEVPIQAAASLSRAVAGLSVYIERFFQPDDVLIIDELEMNAHPQAQVALTEFVAALVNAGVRVVLTTHSPYVVDHLNNLMEASRVPEDRRDELARKFSLGTASSFISPEKVSVYAFQEESAEGAVNVQDVLNRQTGLIDWSTFSRVSEHITNLYSDILRTVEGEE